MSQADGSFRRRPSLPPASAWPPGTSRRRRPGAEGAGGQRPSSPSPPVPGSQLRALTSTGHLIFCSRFAELHKERTRHGGLVLWVLFSVCLMICKVMSLFLFYTFQLIFNLCLENDSCNCTFFCLLTKTRINDNFVLGGVRGAVFFSVHGPAGWGLWSPTLGAPSQREARARPGAQWPFTEQPPRARRLLHCRLL